MKQQQKDPRGKLGPGQKGTKKPNLEGLPCLNSNIQFSDVKPEVETKWEIVEPSPLFRKLMAHLLRREAKNG